MFDIDLTYLTLKVCIFKEKDDVLFFQDGSSVLSRPVDEYRLRQIHAAAVNGDKSLLQKLLSGRFF